MFVEVSDRFLSRRESEQDTFDNKHNIKFISTVKIIHPFFGLLYISAILVTKNEQFFSMTDEEVKKLYRLVIYPEQSSGEWQLIEGATNSLLITASLHHSAL